MRHGMCLGQYDVLHLDAFWGDTLQSQWLVLDEAHAEALRGNFLTDMGALAGRLPFSDTAFCPLHSRTVAALGRTSKKLEIDR